MSIQEKELGMLLGLHVGDSLGATLEFGPASKEWNSHKEIIGGGNLNWLPGAATDDTDLMLAVLKSIPNRRQVNFSKLKKNLIKWLSSEPNDVGATTKEGILALKNKTSPSHNTKTSLSNGSLMRCAPLAFLNLEEEELRKVIKKHTNLTHHAQEVILADELFILCLRKALSGQSKEQIKNFSLSWSGIYFPFFTNSLERLSSTPWSQVPSSGYMLDALFGALWALEHHTTFEDSIISIANRGNDSDTCAAVTGALCGAFYGINNIPLKWQEIIQYKDEIIKTYKRIKDF